jgi:quercetin dioxygenase-like cupin family protein
LSGFSYVIYYFWKNEGTEVEGGPGDTAIIPPGHNAWVVGDEPCVMIDFTAVKDYAKK